MNTTTRTLCLALAVTLGTVSAPALADRDGHRGHRGHYDGPRHEYRDHGHRHDYRHDHRHRSHWVGPAAVLAIAGLAAGAAAWAAQPAPPAYVAPPAPVYPAPAPASSYWSYCGSAGLYYPDVRYCPEGWQRVYP